VKTHIRISFLEIEKDGGIIHTEADGVSIELPAVDTHMFKGDAIAKVVGEEMADMLIHRFYNEVNRAAFSRRYVK